MVAQPILASKPLERRRHQRVPVILRGRYMLPDRSEYPCQAINMSPGGVAVHAPVKGELGDRIVIYFDQVGRVEGVISRLFDTGFALAMTVPALKREKLADQLTWLTNRQSLGMREDRRHERIEPLHKRSTLHVSGREIPVKLIDISLSGAAMSCDYKAAIGTPVVIGETPAKIVRVFEGGVAVEFSREFDPETFSDKTKL
jgi:hypothetical protein